MEGKVRYRGPGLSMLKAGKDNVMMFILFSKLLAHCGETAPTKEDIEHIVTGLKKCSEAGNSFDDKFARRGIT